VNKKPIKYKIRQAIRQRGLTLIETATVLIIFAAFMAGIMLYLQSTNTNSRTNDIVTQLAALQSTVVSFYGGQSTYTGLNTALIADSDALPAKMIGAGSTIKHAFRGDITVAAGAGSDTYIIEVEGIPRDACQKLVSMDLGKNMLSLTTSDDATGVSKRAYSPVGAQTACSSTDVDITWEFY